MNALAQRYVGRCLGGPYDGQELGYSKPTYPIVIYRSTGESFVEQQWWDRAAQKYQNTAYVFRDSTWVWKSE